jgi:hypothetical protein
VKKSYLTASAALLMCMVYTSVGYATTTCRWIPQMCPGEGGSGGGSLPEPATLGLLGAGLGALGLVAWRRRRKGD